MLSINYLSTVPAVEWRTALVYRAFLPQNRIAGIAILQTAESAAAYSSAQLRQVSFRRTSYWLAFFLSTGIQGKDQDNPMYSCKFLPLMKQKELTEKIIGCAYRVYNKMG